MKILLINPPLQRLKGIAHIYFPMGLGYLCAAVSSDKRVNAMIYNAETPDFSERLLYHAKFQDMLKLHKRYIHALHNDNHYVWQEIYKVIKDFNPDLVGLSVMTAKYGSALKISQIIKTINRDCKVVWGGPHATIDPDRVLQNPVVDFVARGEGEITFKKLIDLLIDFKDNFHNELCKIDGLSYKIGHEIFHNTDRVLIENLDTLPFPEKNRIFFNMRYLPSSWGDIVTTRGCPFFCGYCAAHNIWTRRIRYRSPAAVIEEINTIISKYMTREFYFLDDNFTLNKYRAIELCHLLRKIKTRISWSCSTRVDLLDDLIIKEMKRAGCTKVSIGIETGSKRMIENIQKDITLERVNLTIDLLNKYRLRYEAYFLIGFPEETLDDIEQTFNVIKNLKNANLYFSVFTPYPGTQQYEIAKKLNLLPEQPDWSYFSHQSTDNCFTKYIDKEQFSKCVEIISSWIDNYNSRNEDIFRLLWNTYLNLSLLIRRPKLIVNKLKTLLGIIKDRVNTYIVE